MKLSDNKFFLIGSSFLVGALFSYSIISLESSKGEQSKTARTIRDQSINHNRVINKPRVARRKRIDSFDQMVARQQKMMNKLMKDFNQSMSLNMDMDIKGNMGFGGNSLEVSEYSDDKYRYIKLTVDDINKDSLKINIADGRIDITGEIRKEEKNGGSYGTSSSTYVSSFSKSFNVPSLVKEETAKIIDEKGEVIIRFEKV